LLKQEKRLDSNSFDSIVDKKKLKMHAYLFSVFSISRKILENFQKYVLLFLVIKIKLKINCTS